MLQMPDQDSPSQTSAGGCRVGYIGRDRKLFVVLKPDDVENTSTLLEIGEEGFYGMNGMKELETVCTVLKGVS